MERNIKEASRAWADAFLAAREEYEATCEAALADYELACKGVAGDAMNEEAWAVYDAISKAARAKFDAIQEKLDRMYPLKKHPVLGGK